MQDGSIGRLRFLAHERTADATRDLAVGGNAIRNLSIGIVGGSIAGCSAAILLSRAGHDVHVFERSKRGLVGRGGGIGTPGPVLRSMIERDVVDADFPHLNGTTMPFVVRTPDRERYGTTAWTMPLDLAAFHWGALWKTLRSRVPDAAYHQGHEAVGVAQDVEATSATIAFADGSEASFDLVLFADGYRSLGRRLLFPDVHVDYRGYLLWRGLLPEREMERSDVLEGAVPRIAYARDGGNLVMYFVPDERGRTAPGRRIFNWAAYIPLPEADLDAFMVDRNGTAHVGTLPPGSMRPAEERRLKDFMAANVPGYHAEVIEKSPTTYVQLIYTVDVPAYHVGRVALIGDAGIVAPPFTGSGVFKGFTNVEALLEALADGDSLDEALDRWGRQQVGVGRRLRALGDQMEQAFIWNPLDLASASEAETERWWRDAVTFPDDFTYEGTDR